MNDFLKSTRMDVEASLFALSACAFAMSANAQNFVNGDLEGPSPTSLSIVAPGWLRVPSTDPVCLATDGSAGDTPDLTDTLGPSAFTGIVGNPYSGNTFMSGERAFSPGGSWDFQEGIMQNVSGFVPGSTYTIKFYQAVVKSYGSYDSSGGWVVYAGSTLIGTTDPTESQIPYTEWPFIWEERTLAFTATSTNHTIKFLPADDDLNGEVMDPDGSLRMGIDMISILQGIHLTGIDDADPLNGGILSPNPFNDQLTIETPQRFNKGSVFVFTTTGALVHEHTLANTAQMATVDLSGMHAGSYMVRIVLDGTEYRRLVIKE